MARPTPHGGDVGFPSPPRRQSHDTIKMAREVDPDVVVTVEEIRETTAVRTANFGPEKIPMISTVLPWRRNL